MALTDTAGGPWRRAGDRLFGPQVAPWLLPFLTARMGRLVLLILLGFVGTAMALVPPWLTKLVIDQGLMVGDMQATLRWSAALFFVGLLAVGLGVLSNMLHMRASVTMLADLRRALVGDILTRPQAWRSRHQTGELMARLDGDTATIQQFAFNALLTGASAVTRLLGGAVLLFVLEWRLALVALCLAPLELWFHATARPRTETLSHASRAARGALSGQLAEMLNTLPGLQAVRGEDSVTRRIDAAQSDLTQALIHAQAWGELTRAVPQILQAALRGAVFLIGGALVIGQAWPLGSLIAFLAYLGFLTGPLQSLLGLWQAQARVKAALSRVGPLLEDGPRLPEAADPLPLPDTHRGLAFAGITLRNGALMDLTLPAGACCHLSGPSGVGKTQLLSLPQRHADPVGGAVRLDGIDLRDLDLTALRQAVTLVPQRPLVLSASLRENLRLGGPSTTRDEELHDLLALVELTGRFEVAGLDTHLGEDGLTLSGGERQRLCLARALVAPGRVLILDEALSEVDAPCAARIMSRLHARLPHVTRLITTHGDPKTHGPFTHSYELSA